jgi:hypothetical protein
MVQGDARTISPARSRRERLLARLDDPAQACEVQPRRPRRTAPAGQDLPAGRYEDALPTVAARRRRRGYGRGRRTASGTGNSGRSATLLRQSLADIDSALSRSRTNDVARRAEQKVAQRRRDPWLSWSREVLAVVSVRDAARAWQPQLQDRGRLSLRVTGSAVVMHALEPPRRPPAGPWIVTPAYEPGLFFSPGSRPQRSHAAAGTHCGGTSAGPPSPVLDRRHVPRAGPDPPHPRRFGPHPRRYAPPASLASTSAKVLGPLRPRLYATKTLKQLVGCRRRRGVVRIGGPAARRPARVDAVDHRLLGHPPDQDPTVRFRDVPACRPDPPACGGELVAAVRRTPVQQRQRLLVSSHLRRPVVGLGHPSRMHAVLCS